MFRCAGCGHRHKSSAFLESSIRRLASAHGVELDGPISEHLGRVNLVTIPVEPQSRYLRANSEFSNTTLGVFEKGTDRSRVVLPCDSLLEIVSIAPPPPPPERLTRLR